MKRQPQTHSLAVALITTAALAFPLGAQAGTYKKPAPYTAGSYADCKASDKNNQLTGGLIGAIAGGVIGSQVSGNGARTEGSALGAIIGAAAGAAIGDDKRHCRDEFGIIRPVSSYNSTYGTNYNSSSYHTTYPSTTYPSTTYPSSGSHYSSGYTTSYPSSSSIYTTVTSGTPYYGSNYSNGSYHSTHGGGSYYTTYGPNIRIQRKLNRVKARLKDLRRERKRLNHLNQCQCDPYYFDRIRQVNQEIRHLKDKKRRLQAQLNSSSGGHYHGPNICYSRH